MKLKPIYFYGILAVSYTIILLFVSQQNDSEETKNEIANREMPRDNVHNNLNSGMIGSPGESNVSIEIKKKIEDLKNM